MKRGHIAFRYAYECIFIFTIFAGGCTIFREPFFFFPAFGGMGIGAIYLAWARTWKRAELWRLIIVFPIIFFVVTLLGASVFSAFFLALLLTWRGIISFFSEPAPLTPRIEFLLAFGLTAAVTLVSPSFPKLFAGLLLLLFIGLVSESIVFSKDRTDAVFEWGKWIFYVISIVFILAICGRYFLMIVLPVVFDLVSLLAGVLGSLLLWPIFLLFSYLMDESDRNTLQQFLQKRAPEKEEHTRKVLFDQGRVDMPEWTAVAALALLFLVVFLYIYRKRIRLQTDHPVTVLPAGDLLEQKEGSFPRSKWRPLRRNAPKNRVRKKFYDFEKKLFRFGRARQRGETISEWFARIDLNNTKGRIVSRIYEKARYGEREISAEEYADYEHTIGELEEAIKRQYKEEAD